MKRLLISILAICVIGHPSLSEPPERLQQLLSSGFVYRNLGPFRAGSWVSDLAVPDAPAKAHLYTFYVAARNGGVWKTTNNGTTFEPIFEGQQVATIGSIAIAPSNANIVWVGTGDASCTRSANRGDGVYRSTDGGATWQHLGLADSHHIARIVIDPTNPEIVYVAAMGHLFSTNEERGVFKTTDGGKTWRRVLYVDEKTGAVDLLLNRQQPSILYAATYECRRFPWRLEDGGRNSGIYKTTDSGSSWNRLQGGLPGGAIGRIGLDISRKNPDTLYAVIDNRNASTAPEQNTQQTSGPRAGAGQRLIGGEVYRTDNGGVTWHKTNSARDDVGRKTGYAFNQIRVDPNNRERIFITGSSIASSEDGGKTWSGLGGPQANRVFRRAFGDFRTYWIDSENSDRMIAGSDGGVFISYDGGKTCDHLANLPLGEVYALTVDLETPYNIYAGLQDHESWKGPSNGWSGSVGLSDWVTVGTGDGMYNQVDPTDSRWLYNTQEFGRHARFDQNLRLRKTIAPTRPQGQPLLRFNWVAPLRLSPHDPKVLYAGAQVLFRSRDRGDHWEEISPDLTTNNPDRISPPGAAIQFCTITTISESPVKADVIWVGADDGKVQITTNGGATWTDLTPALAKIGAPEDGWVTRVFASKFDPASAYVSKSRHRQDDFRPFLYKTTDYGATWTSITSNLPARPINVVFQDYVNPNLLFVGNDIGVYASIDGGGLWMALKGNMPTVPVHDLVIHPRDADLVAGTYGRGIWVTGIAPLRELNDAVAANEVHFFAVQPKAKRTEGALGGYRLYGDRNLSTPNEPNGLTFVYYLKDAVKEKVTITVTAADGTTVQALDGPAKAGINRVVWDVSGGNRRGFGAPPPPGSAVAGSREPAAGAYLATLQIGEKKYSQKAQLLPGPDR